MRQSRWQLSAFIYLGLLSLALMFYLVASWPGGLGQITPAEKDYLGRLEMPLVAVGSLHLSPLSFADSQGFPRGYEADLLKMVANELGIEIQHRLLPYPEAQMALEKGEADLLLGAVPHPAGPGLGYTDPYLPYPIAAVVPADSGEMLVPRDLTGLSLVFRPASHLGQIIPSGGGTALIPASTPREALEILTSGGAEAWIEDERVARQVVEEMGLSHRFAVRPLETDAGGYALMSLKNRSSLIGLVNKSLASLKRQGKLDKLDVRWIGPAVGRPEDSSFREFLLMGGAVFLAAAISGFFVLNDFWARRIQEAESEAGRAWARLRSRAIESRQMMQDMAQALARTADASDPYAEGHSQRVACLSQQLARAMGLDEEAIHIIKLGGLVHDVGKVRLPEHLFTQRGGLSWQDWTLIRLHPELGVEILKEARVLAPVLDLVRYHHERWDGSTDADHSGYPGCLSGPSIPLGARIIAVADAYDAMISPRPYRRGMPPSEAIRRIQKETGGQFDPGVVEAFCQLKLQGEEGKILAFPEVS